MRTRLSHKYLKGFGCEIGGLHAPLPLLAGCKVQYIDRAPWSEIKKAHPDVNPVEFPIVVDDGEKLDTVAGESLDFLIANHVYEHTQNPMLTLNNWLRVLKPGGIIFAAVPDRSRCFDRDRKNTTWAHVLEDYQKGPKGSQEEHYRDYFSKVDKLSGEKLESRVMGSLIANTNIHFHCWDEPAQQELFREMQNWFKFEILESPLNDHEVLWILRKPDHS